MASALDELDELPDPARARRTTLSDPFDDSFFRQTPHWSGNDDPFPTTSRAAARLSRAQAAQDRVRAEDLHARGIPTFKNASGGTSPVTDETGEPLTALDRRHNIAYDSKGQPKQISYGETGEPQLSDPFEAIPAKVDKKTGAMGKFGPGGIYRYEGQDPVVTAQVARKEKDANIQKEATLLNRKLTLDEHDLHQGASDVKMLKSSLIDQVPILQDPKFEDSDRPTVLKAIDEHFNAQYAAEDANETKGWFGDELSDNAKKRRAEIDAQKARAMGHANTLFDTQDEMNVLDETVQATRQEERDRIETLLAHQQGREGPLDLAQPEEVAAAERVTGGKAQLYPPREDWERMLGGKEAVAAMLKRDATGAHAVSDPQLGTVPVGSDKQDVMSVAAPSKIGPAIIRENPELALKAQDKLADPEYRQKLSDMMQGTGRHADLLTLAAVDLSRPEETLSVARRLRTGRKAELANIHDSIYGDTPPPQAGFWRELGAGAAKGGIKALASPLYLAQLVEGLAITPAETAIQTALGQPVTNYHHFETLTGALDHALEKFMPRGQGIANLTKENEKWFKRDAEDKITGFNWDKIDPAALKDPKWWAASLGENAPQLLMPMAVMSNANRLNLGSKIVQDARALLQTGGGTEAAMKAATKVMNGYNRKLAYGTSFLMEAQGQLDDARRGPEGEYRDLTTKDYLAAGISSLFAAGFDAVPDAAVYNMWRKAFKGAPKGVEKEVGNKFIQLAKDLGKGAAFETPTEAIQTIIENAGAKYGWDPHRDLSDGVLETLVITPFLTGGPTVISHAAGALAERKAGPTAPPTAPPSAPTPPTPTPPGPAPAPPTPTTPTPEAGAPPPTTPAPPGPAPAPTTETPAPTEGGAPGPAPVPAVEGGGPAPVTPVVETKPPVTETPKPVSETPKAPTAPTTVAKGTHELDGVKVQIQFEAGETRKEGHEPLGTHYGSLPGVKGEDGQNVDVVVPAGTTADHKGPAIVLYQHKADGTFDEHKLVYGKGVTDEASARAAYRSNFPAGMQLDRAARKFDSLGEAREWLVKQRELAEAPAPATPEAPKVPAIPPETTEESLTKARRAIATSQIARNGIAELPNGGTVRILESEAKPGKFDVVTIINGKREIISDPANPTDMESARQTAIGHAVEAHAKPATPAPTEPAAEPTPAASGKIEVRRADGTTGENPHAPQTAGEHVLSTAVKTDDGILVGRHWNEGHDAIGVRHNIDSVPEGQRGFIVQRADGTHVFVTRSDALAIAKTSGQLRPGLAADYAALQSADLKKVDTAPAKTEDVTHGPQPELPESPNEPLQEGEVPTEGAGPDEGTATVAARIEAANARVPASSRFLALRTRSVSDPEIAAALGEAVVAKINRALDDAAGLGIYPVLGEPVLLFHEERVQQQLDEFAAEGANPDNVLLAQITEEHEHALDWIVSGHTRIADRTAILEEFSQDKAALAALLKTYDIPNYPDDLLGAEIIRMVRMVRAGVPLAENWTRVAELPELLPFLLREQGPILEAHLKRMADYVERVGASALPEVEEEIPEKAPVTPEISPEIPENAPGAQVFTVPRVPYGVSPAEVAIAETQDMIQGTGERAHQTLTLADGTEVGYTYSIVDGRLVVDNPENERPGPEHPETQEFVAAQSGKNFDDRKPFVEDPDFQKGPPVAEHREGRVVLDGGHRRTYIYRNNRAAYEAALLKNAARFGVDPVLVQTMLDNGAEPYLVALIDEPITPEQRTALVRDLNTVDQQATNPVFDAVSAGRVLTPDSIDEAGTLFEGAHNSTPLAALKTAAAKGLSDAFLRDGAIRTTDRNKYVEPNGAFTDEGAKFARYALLGRVVDSPATLAGIADSPAETKLLNAIGQLHILERRGQDMDLFRQMLEMEHSRLQSGEKLNRFQDLLDQDFLLQRNPRADALHRWFDKFSSRDARAAFNKLINDFAPVEKGAQSLLGEKNVDIGEALIAREKGDQLMQALGKLTGEEKVYRMLRQKQEKGIKLTPQEHDRMLAIELSLGQKLIVPLAPRNAADLDLFAPKAPPPAAPVEPERIQTGGQAELDMPVQGVEKKTGQMTMFALPKRPPAPASVEEIHGFHARMNEYRTALEKWAAKEFPPGKPMAFQVPGEDNIVTVVTKDTYPKEDGGNVWRMSWFYDYGKSDLPPRIAWNGQVLEGWVPSGHSNFETLGEALASVNLRSAPTDVTFAQPKRKDPNVIDLPGLEQEGELHWGPGRDGGDYIGKTRDGLEYLVQHDPQTNGYTAYFKEADGAYTVLAKPEPTLKLAKRIAESHLSSKRADDAQKPIRRTSFKLDGPRAVAAGQQTELTLRPERPPPPPGFKPKPVALMMTRSGMTWTSPVNYLPEFMTRILKPHQAKGANLALHAFARGRGFLNGDGTGAGKTMQEIAVAAVMAQGGTGVSAPLEWKKIETPGDYSMTTGDYIQVWETTLPQGSARIIKSERLDNEFPFHLNFVEGTTGQPATDFIGNFRTLAEAQAKAQEYAKPEAKRQRVLIVTENDTIIQNAFAKDSELLGVEMWRYMGDDVVPGRVYAATYTQVRSGLVIPGSFDTVIFDEAHNLRNVLGETAQAVAGGALARQAKNVMYASATPLDRPEQVAYLLPILGSTLDTYFKRLGITMRQKENKKTGEITITYHTSDAITDEMQESVMQDILAEITRNGQMIKRDVPLNNISVAFKEVKISDAAYDHADDLYDRIYNEMYEKSKFNAGGVAGMTVRGYLETQKLDAAMEDALAAIAEGKQVVIFADRIEEGEEGKYTEGIEGTLNELVTRLEAKLGKGNVGKVFGGQRARSAQDISRYQNGDIKVIVATPKSGGTGINLDDIFGDTPRHLIVMTAPMSGLDLVQIIGRINRLTTLSKGSASVLFVEHPVDTWNLDIGASKLATLSAAVSGDLQKIKPVHERTAEIQLNDDITLLADEAKISEDEARAKLTSDNAAIADPAKAQVKAARDRMRQEATELRRNATSMSEEEMLRYADDPTAFSRLSPGHAHFQRALDNYVASSTLSPIHAQLLRAVFSQSRGEFLARFIFEANKKMQALGRGGRRGGSPLIIMKEGRAAKHIPEVAGDPGKVFMHEFGHAGYYTLLTPTERRLVNRIYAKMGGRRGVADYFGSVNPQQATSNKRYYSKNVYEFFAQGFAEYVFEKRVPTPMLKRMYDNLLSVLKKFYNALRRRSEVNIEELRPLFAKIMDLKENAKEVDFSYPARESFVTKPQVIAKGAVTTKPVTGEGPKAFIAKVSTEGRAGRSRGWLERYYRRKAEVYNRIAVNAPPDELARTLSKRDREVVTSTLKPGDQIDWNGTRRTIEAIHGVVIDHKVSDGGVSYTVSRMARPGEKPELRLDTNHYLEFEGGAAVRVTGQIRVKKYADGEPTDVTLALGRPAHEVLPPPIDDNTPPPAEGRYRTLPPVDQINLNDVPEELRAIAKRIRETHNTDRGDKSRWAILKEMRKLWEGYRHWPLPITHAGFLARYGTDWDGHAINRELTPEQRGQAKRSLLNVSTSNGMLDLYLSRTKNKAPLLTKEQSGAVVSSLGHLLKADELPPAKQVYKPAEESGQMTMLAQGKRVASFKSGANTDALIDAYRNVGDNIGVELQDLKARRMVKLTDYVNSGKGQVFIDSGAFRAFQSGETLDFDKVMADYRRITNSVDEPYRGNLSLVMPDVIGDQKATMELVRAHKDSINGLIRDGVRVIMPMQQGQPLPETDAQYTKILGTASYVPGIPSKAAAFPKNEVIRFIRTEKPREVHLLGMNDNPKNAAYIKLIQAVSPQTRITMDGTWHRAKVGEGRPITETRRNILADKADDTEMTGSLFLDRWEPEGRHMKLLADTFGSTPEELQKAAKSGNLPEKLTELSYGSDQLVHLRIKAFTDKVAALEYGPEATREAIEHVSREPAVESVTPEMMLALPKRMRAMMPFIEAGQKIKRGMQELLLPSAISAEHLDAAEGLRARLGPMHRAQEVARSTVTPVWRMFERLGVNAEGPLGSNPGVEFMSNMATGNPQATPELEKAEVLFEKLLRERVVALAAAGAPIARVRANYFPGMWSRESRRAFNQALDELIPFFPSNWTVDTATPAQMKMVKDRVDELLERGEGSDKDMFGYFTRSPMKGPERFRKKKVFDDIMTGVDFGLRPISNNPADLIMGKLSELDKSIMAHEYFADLKDNGQIKVIPPTAKVPEGWVKLNDKYGTVYAPPTPGVYGLRIVGQRIVPKEVGDIVNNYLSSSLYNNQYFGSLYKGWMGLANALNQTQLGVGSAFHAGFTTVEAQISAVANLIKDVFGVMRGNRTLGQLTKTAGMATIATVETAKTGGKVLNAWRNPNEPMDPRIRQVVRAAELAGAGFKLERGLVTTQLDKQYSDWFSGHKVRAALRSPVAFIELLAKPIMELLVPRQKAGVFAHMVWRIIEQNPGVPLIDLAPEFSSAWNRIDARLGQVRYDRLFLNNVAKNIIQGMIRAPGWSGGTIAELAGGAKDTATFFKEWAKTGSVPKDVPDRVAYTTALLLTVGVLNAALTALFTGDRPEGDDFWAFRTGRQDESGNPERFTLPSYLKDVYAYWKDAGGTITHKTHPLLSLLGELMTNKDYYNVQIRDEDANYAKQAAQAGMHFIKAFTPFWIRGYQKAAERGSGIPERVLPLIGVMPAPRGMNQSAAVARAEKYWSGTKTEAGVKPAQFESQTAKRQLVKDIRSGRTPNIAEALRSGKLKPADIKPLYKRAQMGSFASQVSHMPLAEAEEVFKLATPTERAQIAGLMARKRANSLGRATSTGTRRRARSMFGGF